MAELSLQQQQRSRSEDVAEDDAVSLWLSGDDLGSRLVQVAEQVHKEEGREDRWKLMRTAFKNGKKYL